MSKFESFIKGMTVTVEFIFLCAVAGGFEVDSINELEFILYTFSSLIIASYIYNKSHDWGKFILRKLK